MSEQSPSRVLKPKKASRTASVKAPLFRVIMHNDDYTTMEFVVQMLETVFRKNPAEAHRIMLNIHLRGTGTCGVYPFEVAETKICRVHKLARAEGFPLRCSLQEA